jgi:hypothetical protein
MSSMIVSSGLSLGEHKGGENEMEDILLSNESCSHNSSGFLIKSTRYTL